MSITEGLHSASHLFDGGMMIIKKVTIISSSVIDPHVDLQPQPRRGLLCIPGNENGGNEHEGMLANPRVGAGR